MNQMNSIIMALAGAERIFKMIDEEPEVDDGYVTLVNAKKDKNGKVKITNPNVPVSELENNWVNNTCVVYIGKATTLSKRISQYLRFGDGENIGHWGGRLIWQIKDSKDLQLCWKPVDTNPREEEKRLIADFKRQYDGKRPFANLQD